MTSGLILSGGWGTRLRPLTCTIPKTLIPVLNTPVIERQMNLLKEAGVEEIILAVSVMAEDLKKYFGGGERMGIKIHYTDEKSPMGTAGALKLAEPFLKDDNFFMLNGDVILNFSFKKMLETHNSFDGIGTIASRVVENPARYGVLIIDEKTQKIKQFLEKEEYYPKMNDKEEMPVNAGVYILEPQVFDYIAPRKKLSIERDIFPKLTAQKKIYHYPISGIWKDIGKPDELLDGNILLMKDILKKSKVNKENLIKNSVDIHDSVKIIPPVTIGEKTVIRQDCIIGPDVVIGDNVYIERNCKIENSLIYKEVYIYENSEIQKAIIADNSSIHKNCKLRGGKNSLVILASYVAVDEDIELIAPPNQSITFCHHELVKESIT